MGACPERIFGFKNYNVDIIGSMIKSVDIPDDDEDKLRIIALVCENDAYPTLDMAGMSKYVLNNLVRVIPVRCLGWSTCYGLGMLYLRVWTVLFCWIASSATATSATLSKVVNLPINV